MNDVDSFERDLTAALVVDADANLVIVEPSVVARAAMIRRPGAVVSLGRRTWSVQNARFLVVAAAAVLILAVAFSLRPMGANWIGGGTASPSQNTPSPTTYPSGRWQSAPSMTTARGSGSVAILLLDGRVLVATGDPSLRSAEIYDPIAGTWTATGSMVDSRLWPTAVLLADGRVLLVGGFASREPYAPIVMSAELYDPATGTWSATEAPAYPQAGGGVRLLDGRVLIAGSTGTEVYRAETEIYDPAAGTWAMGAPMVNGDSGNATLLQDGRVLVAGGGNRERSSELYDPATDSWRSTATLPERFTVHTATLLLDGKVLVAGGNAPTGAGARGWPHAAVFDPASEAWVMVSSMARGRIHHTAVRLPDGRVLVAGGGAYGNPTSDVFSDSEIFDPATARWTNAPAMHQARTTHQAVLLKNGMVLVIGGWIDEHVATASTELFDPLGSP